MRILETKGLPRSRSKNGDVVCWFENMADYIRFCSQEQPAKGSFAGQYGSFYMDHQDDIWRKGREERPLTVLKTGWDVALTALKTTAKVDVPDVNQEEEREFFWNEQGFLFNRDRLRMGDVRCFYDQRTTIVSGDEYVTLIFNYAVNGGLEFAQAVATLLRAVQDLEDSGRSVRVVAVDACASAFNDQGNMFPFILVKDFQDPVNLPVLSGLGFGEFLHCIGFRQQDLLGSKTGRGRSSSYGCSMSSSYGAAIEAAYRLITRSEDPVFVIYTEQDINAALNAALLSGPNPNTSVRS